MGSYARRETFGILGVLLAALLVGGISLAGAEGPVIYNLIGLGMICLFVFLSWRATKHITKGGF